MKRSSVGVLALAGAAAAAIGVLWVKTEGWVWTPAAGHWWWHTASGWILGLSHGNWLRAWRHRRATRALRELARAPLPFETPEQYEARLRAMDGRPPPSS